MLVKMRSSVLETLTNILFLSSLRCVLASVVSQHSVYRSHPETWKKAGEECRELHYKLLTEAEEVGRMPVININSQPKWINQMEERTHTYTSYYSSTSYTMDYCAQIRSTHDKTLLFTTNCYGPYTFYCYDDDQQSPPVKFVPWAKSWSGAVQYCKDTYKELVTLKGSIQLEDLPDDDEFPVWTGIRRPAPDGDWVSSDDSPIYEDWAAGQPTAEGDCVGIFDMNKKLTNLDCETKIPFMCFKNNLVLVKENKTWEEAVQHCRAMGFDPSMGVSNTELISITSWDHNTVWAAIGQAATDEVWTGLRYLAHQWFWVDGTNVPYEDLPQCPDLGQHCGTLDRNNITIPWRTRDCTEKRNFLCYRKY